MDEVNWVTREQWSAVAPYGLVAELLCAAQSALKIMLGDDLYRTEYERFVDAMSYAPDDERISFDEAVTHFRQLAPMFESW